MIQLLVSLRDSVHQLNDLSEKVSEVNDRPPRVGFDPLFGDCGLTYPYRPRKNHKVKLIH